MIDGLGNFGNSTIGGFKGLIPDLSFELLFGLLDFRFDLIQLTNIGRHEKTTFETCVSRRRKYVFRKRKFDFPGTPLYNPV